MSEDTTTPAPDAEQEQATDDQTQEQATQEQATTPEQTPNSEAARRRHQLREVEAERDQLRDQLAAQRRAMIEWRVANHPGGAIDPQLLTAAGLDFADLTAAKYTGEDATERGILDDEGQLSMEALDAFAEAVARRFNVARLKSGPAPNPQQGIAPGKPSSTWAAVIKDRNR